LYNNLNATIIFLPLIVLSGEVPTILESPTVRTLNFWLLMCLGGLLGVSISFATAAQIKYTSPLTHNVSATAKAAAQTVIALVVYRNPITSLGALSVAVVLGGSMCYALVRRGEMQRKTAADVAARKNADSETEIIHTPLLNNASSSSS
jgi:solute carrier family 35 (GDP-fucose transporter), member C1